MEGKHKHLCIKLLNLIRNVNFDLVICKNTNILGTKRIYDAMMSFPSGHAQLAWFSAAFACVYICHRVGTNYSKVWKFWLQIAICLGASFVSISRLHDHRHHPLDVLFGAGIGTAFGIVSAQSIKYTTAANVNRPEGPKKEKRPSQMRLIQPEFSYGAVVQHARVSREVGINPGC